MKKNFKKILCTMLAVLMLLTAAPLSGFVGLEWSLPDLSFKASAQEIYTEDAYSYTVSQGTATITDYNDSYDYAEKVIIPATLDGYPVVAIGDNAFDYAYGVTEITIPNTVTTIGKSAFYYCTYLKKINIPSSVKSIGDHAFYYCNNLTSINIPDSVKTIGAYAFYNCSNLTSITLPEGLTTIEDYTFSNCYNLTSINIPDSVKSIGAYAFTSCYDLTSITLPEGLTAIEDYTFCYCDKLTSINIPDSVKSIGAYAFTYCYNLTNINIPDSVKSIGDYAFESCNRLTSINIPAAVEYIGERAFHSCYDITKITVAPGNTAYSSDENGVLFNKDKTVLIAYPVGNKAEAYSVPGSVTTISDYAFYSSDLKSLTIPDSVTSIGKNAFQSSSLVNLTIGKGLAAVGVKALNSCYYIESVTVDEGNPYISVVNNVLFNKDKTELVMYIRTKDSSSEAYVIPDGVTKIGDYAFYGENNLKSITIPDSVKVIGDSAFESCSGLTDITFGKGLTTIGNKAFYSCYSLSDITVPEGVTSIGDEAFYCYNLDYITIPASVASIGKNAVYSDAIIYCNKASAAHTYAVENNRHYILLDGSAEDNTVNGSVGSISWTLYKLTGVLEIKGSGDMPYAGWEQYWRKHYIFVKYIKISEGITGISEEAFRSFSRLKTVSIPASVTSIGAEAFDDCNSLEGFTINKNNKSFSTDSHGVLYNFEKTELILYPCSNSVTAYVIPDGVTTIGESAFASCYNLESITIPSSVTKIEWDAFNGCENLEKVCITDLKKWCEIDFESYGSNPLCYGREFEQQSGLYLNNTLVTDMVIPEGTTRIGKYAFLNYNYLLSVKIPASVTEIGDMAFAICFYLSDITVDENNAHFTTDEHGVLFDKDMTRLICYPTGMDGVEAYEELELILETDRIFDYFTEYTVPDTVKTIDAYAFGYYNLSVIKITLPEGLENIYESAMRATIILSLKIPASVTEIGAHALPQVLRSAEIAEGATVIEDGTFGECSSLECIIIPDTVTEIKSYAFPDYSDTVLDVYYTGTEEQWNAIDISPDSGLSRANIHFNYSCDNHVYEEIIEGVCAGGIKLLTCDCGWRYYTIYKEENPSHVMSEWIIVEPATCQKEGQRGRYCTICEYHIELESYIGDHEYETVVTAPTCTAQGYTTYTCDCGHSYKGDYVSANNHSYTSTVVTPATHTSTGLMSYTCSACNNSYTGEIAKTPEHSYTALYTIEPGCESEGYTLYSCECGHTYNGDKKAATGHSYDGDKCIECGQGKSDNCSCNCHKSGFMGFIWKIINFFNKIFGSNKTCACGVSHY